MSPRAPTLGAPSLRRSSHSIPVHLFRRLPSMLHGIRSASSLAAPTLRACGPAAFALATLGACGGPAGDDTASPATVTQSFSRGHAGQVRRGERLFDEAFADTN